MKSGLQSSNSALGNVLAGAAQEQGRYAQAGYPAPYGSPEYGAPQVRTLTVDAVVIRTVFLLLLVGASAAASWILLPSGSAATFPIVMGASVIGLVLGLVIAFKRVTNPWIIGAYAVTQGVWLGLISSVFDLIYPGIVLQAIISTFGVFVGMALLYKFKVIRNSPRLTKMIMGATIGLAALMVLNLVVGIFNSNGIGIRAGLTGGVGWLPWVFSIVAIVVASLNFVIDFDMIEQGVARGLPEKYAWSLSFGIVVGLIWLYMEMLRLLSYLRR